MLGIQYKIACFIVNVEMCDNPNRFTKGHGGWGGDDIHSPKILSENLEQKDHLKKNSNNYLSPNHIQSDI